MLLLDIDKPDELENYLRATGWLDAPLEGVARAGEGNMNLVLRACSATGRSIIIKQSRDWVEKYPDIAAPGDRICVEAAFYRAVSENPELASRMPGLIAFDEDNRIALFEDLGQAADFTDVYADGHIDGSAMDELWDWLSELHALRLDPQAMPLLENRAMRELNHAHIFDIPLQGDNGLDLDPVSAIS